MPLTSIEESISQLVLDPVVRKEARRIWGPQADVILRELEDGRAPTDDEVSELEDIFANQRRVYYRAHAEGYCGEYPIEVQGLGGIYVVWAPECGKAGPFDSMDEAVDYISSNWIELSDWGRQVRPPFRAVRPRRASQRRGSPAK